MVKEDFQNVLVDVRKAYRLLYLYQRRVLDLAQFVGDSLLFRYSGGWSWFSNSAPKDGKGNLGNCAWDWLNMYFYEFNFEDRTIDNNLIRFSMIVQSDTGYFDGAYDDFLNIEKYAPAETSSSRILFLAGKNSWHTEFKEFEDPSEFYKKEFSEVIKEDERGGTTIMKAFDLADFLDHDTTIKCVKEFVMLCNANGISELDLIY